MPLLVFKDGTAGDITTCARPARVLSAVVGLVLREANPDLMDVPNVDKDGT
jgi:hypothetical protein